MEDKRGVETAEGLAGDQASSVQASIQGALKSQSSNNERAKRASAVRFADQVQMEDEMSRLHASQEEPIRQSAQESAKSSNAADGMEGTPAATDQQNSSQQNQPVAKVKGRQLVGSVDIEEGDELAAAEIDDDELQDDIE